MLTKTSAYVKRYDRQTKWMYFLIEDNDLLEKYNTIWDKVSADTKKKFGSHSINIKVFLRNKKNLMVMKLQAFMVKKVPKVDSNHICLAEISLDSALKKDENYYLQVFLKQCKYIEKKVIGHINDNLSGFSSFDESDEEQIRIS